MSLMQIVEQLEKCKYKDELGQKLEMHTAWIELKNLATEEENEHDEYAIDSIDDWVVRRMRDMMNHTDAD